MRRVSICLAVLAALVFPAAAQATTIVVNSTEPVAPKPACGLADAIDAANFNVPSGGCPAGEASDRIEFALPSLPATINLTAKLKITSSVEIAGPGAAQLTVSGGGVVRVFEASSGISSIADLTIADGHTDETGAGVLVQEPATLQLTRVTLRGNEVEAHPGSSNPKLAEGGAIFNQGKTTLTESTVTGNVARNVTIEPGVESNGGGVASQRGVLVIERSTVSGNTAVVEGSGTSDARGGGIFIFRLTDSAVRGSTVSGNDVKVNNEMAGDDASGGGIFVWETTPQVPIQSSTIAGNTAATAGANVFAAGPVALANTIVARPLSGASCGGGAITSLGYNLDEGSSCGFGSAGDQSGIDPLLAPALAANGGATPTLALLNDSPAIDHGLAAGGETADQRGFKRPLEIPEVPNAAGGDGADIGAFEVQVARTVISRGPRDGETIGDAEPTFDFFADGVATGFVCSIDGAAPAPCASPFRTPALSNGSHSFTVVALGEAGYSGEPLTRTFTVDVRPPAPKPTEPVVPTTVKRAAPQARIGGLPQRTVKRRLTIRFSASEPQSTFSCKLDQRKWRSCRSPFTTPRLALGRHVLKVKATGPTGLVSPAPATKTFQVVAPRR